MIASYQPDSSHRLSALAAGAMAGGLAVMLYSGRLDSSDEQMMAATSRSLATSASLEFPEMYGQTFTGYGVGTPLVGVPFAWVDMMLGGASVSPALVLLANALLLGVAVSLTVLVLIRLGWCSPWMPWAVVGVALASPALPLALRYYSDVLAGCGLLAVAGGLVLGRPGLGRWAGVLTTSGAAMALMARPSMLPLVLLVIVWGIGLKRTKSSLFFPVLGILIGLGVRAAQNWILRGSPFAQGYDGQEFTTPLVTGLHGLMFSPERGLLVFWPVVLVPLLPIRNGGGLARRWRILSLGALITAAVMHGAFWTWHGGWTVGPRFVLPALILAMPSVVLGLRELMLAPSLVQRLTGILLWIWGAWLGFLHSVFHAPDAYRLAWNFHGLENRWLFEPQLSLLRWWKVLAADGAWYPAVLRWFAGSDGLGRDGAVALGAGSLLLLAGVLLLISKTPLPPRQAALRLAELLEFRSRAWAWAGSGVLVLAICVAGVLRGERGVLTQEGARINFARVHGVPPGESGRLEGLLDLAPHGVYRFYGRVRGAYQVRVDGLLVAEGVDREVPRHLFEGQFAQSESGIRLLEIEIEAPEGETGLLELYWSWPGEGVMLEPVGGEYVMPHSLTPLQELASRVWRQRWLIMVFGVFVLVLADAKIKPRRRV